ncbi:DUF4199 domain-containing protein [Ulvibacter litoralis]|uniref:DUF4199 domain-containing protein n=1 Tax=Ulvibacter litoralis TaxID=227084 RepID=A0A1G7CUG9_9FLAO|nr:DUF4199 domain-containing protein [Ulvibacter litoralis]GHC46044.1 hypothetical protein GCM10008083_06250 [Ulvibacter litoralis]SDE42873.1 hypothetical protein SAMN05421855_101572 [Ulvibacter litoralis]
MGKIAIKYGIGTAVVLIVYFLLLKVVGLHEFPVLSVANGIIFGVGILIAMQKYKASGKSFFYQDGFQLGLVTGAIATILFSIFMALYIFQIDTEFAHAILDSWSLNYNKGGLIIIVTLIMMGFSTTLVLTLAFMQLLKDSWNATKHPEK